MFWYFLRILFHPYFKFYFYRSQGRNLDRIRVKNPVLIAMNHPNAFMDPIGLSIVLYNPRTFYMARGDAFKKGFVANVLTATGIIPIFRMRDAGIEGVKKNNESFSIAYKMWAKNRKIMVFAEGLCIQERRLRSIQKGTARMAFGFMEEYKREDFLVIPVSVMYSHPAKFGGDVFYDVGEAIPVKDFMPLYKENPAKGVNELTRVLESKMKDLVPHLNDKENDRLAEQLQAIYKHQYLSEHNLDHKNLEHQQEYWFHMVERLNELTAQDPEKAEKLRKTTDEYTRLLGSEKIHDINVYDTVKAKGVGAGLWLKLVAGFPLFAVGKLLNYIPWAGANAIAKKLAKEVEFFTSMNYVIGIFFAVFYLIAELLIIWFVFKTWWLLPAYFAFKIITGYFALKYSRFKTFALGAIRTNALAKKDPDMFKELVSKRNDILSILTAREALFVK